MVVANRAFPVVAAHTWNDLQADVIVTSAVRILPATSIAYSFIMNCQNAIEQ